MIQAIDRREDYSIKQFRDVMGWVPYNRIAAKWRCCAIPKMFVIQHRSTSRHVSFARLEQIFPRAAIALIHPAVRSISWSQGKRPIKVTKQRFYEDEAEFLSKDLPDYLDGYSYCSCPLKSNKNHD